MSGDRGADRRRAGHEPHHVGQRRHDGERRHSPSARRARARSREPAIRPVAKSARGACSSRSRSPATSTCCCRAAGRSSGRRVLITAGPTRERIDPVRFISNRSSGKWALRSPRPRARPGPRSSWSRARAAADPGRCPRVSMSRARQTCSPPCCGRCRGTTSSSRRRRSPTTGPARAAGPEDQEDRRHPRSHMERTTDVLATVAARPGRPFVVGFAAETEAVEQNARTKLLQEESRHDRCQRGRPRQGLRLRGQRSDRPLAQCAPRARPRPTSSPWRAN